MGNKKGREGLSGPIPKSMMGNGNRAYVMEKEYKFGLMEEPTWEITNMMLSMDLVYTHGQIERDMKGSGRMVSKMERELSLIQKVPQEMEFLKKEKL